MRDQMLTEAQRKRNAVENQAKQDETQQVRELQLELRNEKVKAASRKEKERTAARKVIAENEVEKKNRMIVKQAEKKVAADII